MKIEGRLTGKKGFGREGEREEKIIGGKMTKRCTCIVKRIMDLLKTLALKRRAFPPLFASPASLRT